jgi:hypothetical protein
MLVGLEKPCAERQKTLLESPTAVPQLRSDPPCAAVDHQHAAQQQRRCDDRVQQSEPDGVLHKCAHHILVEEVEDEQEHEHPAEQRNVINLMRYTLGFS